MRRQIQQLDGVRALAVLAVMGFHDLKVPAGFLGVDVFFVLSGMLITTILLGQFDRRGTIDLRAFYERRARRLYPALLALLILLSPIGSWLSVDGTWQKWWDSVFVAATYTANIAMLVDGTQFLGALGPTWSLAVEVQFYLLWPPLLYLLLRRRLPTRTLLSITAVLSLIGLSLFWILPTANDPLLAVAPSYFRPDTRFGEMLAGCVLAFALRGRTLPLRRSVDVAVSLGAFAGLGLILLGATKVFREHGSVVPMPLVAVGTTLVLARLVTSDGALLSRLLRLPPLPQIGRISYAMYLWQYPMLDLTLHWNMTGARQQWFFWTGTLVAGVISTYVIERRFWTPRPARLPANAAQAEDPPVRSGSHAAGDPAGAADRAAV
jgi:peptidoglycan/LPS O-acetylase OafA/YrhL